MAALNDTHEFTPPGPWCHECGNYVTDGRHHHGRKLHPVAGPPFVIRAAVVSAVGQGDSAAGAEAIETQRAAFEADFNKFLAQQSNIGLLESATGRMLTGQNVYLKIRADGPAVEIPACEVEMSVHYPGCGCIVCGIAMAEGVAQSEGDLGRQFDDAIGFVPMSPKPAPEPLHPSPIPARALRYGVAEAPLLEWPE